MDFARRLREATKNIRPQDRVAALAGVARPTWQRYLTGEREPGFLAVARLAEAAHLDLNWLAYGRSTPIIDEGLMIEIVTLVEEEAARRGYRPPPEKIAALIVHCYIEESRAGDGEGRTADPIAIRRAFRLIS